MKSFEGPSCLSIPKLCRVAKPASKRSVYTATQYSRRYIGGFHLLQAARTRSLIFYIYYTPNLKKNQI